MHDVIFYPYACISVLYAMHVQLVSIMWDHRIYYCDWWWELQWRDGARKQGGSYERTKNKKKKPQTKKMETKFCGIALPWKFSYVAYQIFSFNWMRYKY